VHPAELVRLTTSDGVPIVADHWPADTELAYVVAHGFTGSSRVRRLRRIAAQFAGTGAAVLALDFRGHGRSGGHSTLGDLEVHDVAAAVAFSGPAAMRASRWSAGQWVAPWCCATRDWAATPTRW
jgi:alpha-beta hydrolase superfamily lysophospholipase